MKPKSSDRSTNGKVQTSSPKLKTRSVRNARPAVGWREWAALPDLGVKDIKVKIDTGARTSALHAFNVVPFTENGVDRVCFDIHPFQRSMVKTRACVHRVHDVRRVTNSGGHREQRLVILTALRLGGEQWPVEITLADRDQMGFRMLIGRTAIKGRFVVDPARSFCLARPARRSTPGVRRTKRPPVSLKKRRDLS